ncbi:MAG: methyltransferase [Methanotrichaceae archaeon]|nr:methyltransferase [Methanotrichaceae archaeon]
MDRDSRLEETYEPAEDTFLLLKAALLEANPSDSVIEIGCGRAIISCELAKKVKCILATDINPYAIRLARDRGINAIRADLFRGLKARFDLIIFNPPYLPTTADEKLEGWLNLALDGGEQGRDTIYRFLEQIKDHFSPEGRSLLLISSLTGLKEVKEKAWEEGLIVSELVSTKLFFERLFVIKIQIGG